MRQHRPLDPCLYNQHFIRSIHSETSSCEVDLPFTRIPMPVSQGHNQHKMSKRSRSQKDMTNVEIQALLSKLKEIVPNMPRNRKLSKLEIIQNVIDYIVDLQIALESHPVPNRGVNLRIGSPVPRQPLGVIPSEPNSPANICGSREDGQVDKILPRSDGGLKPPYSMPS